jgi:hypothetical protein
MRQWPATHAGKSGITGLILQPLNVVGNGPPFHHRGQSVVGVGQPGNVVSVPAPFHNAKTIPHFSGGASVDSLVFVVGPAMIRGWRTR